MKAYHSRSYHEFFEGYTEKELIDEKGHPKIVRVYTGDYYEADLTDCQKKRNKIMVFSMYIAAVCIFICSGIQNVSVNMQKWVVLFEAISLFIMYLLLKPLFYYLVNRQPYTIGIYKIASEKLIQHTKKLACCCWITAGVMIVYTAYFVIIGIQLNMPKTVFCIFGELTCGFLFFCILKLESKTRYIKQASDEVRPENGVRIRF